MFYLYNKNSSLNLFYLKDIGGLKIFEQIIKRLVVETHVGQDDLARIGHERIDLVHDGLELHLLFAQVLELMHVEFEVTREPRLEYDLQHDVLLFVLECGRAMQLHEQIERVVDVRVDELEKVTALWLLLLLRLTFNVLVQGTNFGFFNYIRSYFVIDLG